MGIPKNSLNSCLALPIPKLKLATFSLLLLFLPFTGLLADIDSDVMTYGDFGAYREFESKFTAGRIVGVYSGDQVRNVRITGSLSDQILWEDLQDPGQRGQTKYLELRSALKGTKFKEGQEHLPVTDEEINEAKASYEARLGAREAAKERVKLFNEVRQSRLKLMELRRQMEAKLLSKKIDPREEKTFRLALEGLVSSDQAIKSMGGRFAFMEGNYASIRGDRNEVINVRVTKIYSDGKVDVVQGFIDGGSNRRFKGLEYGKLSYPKLEKDKKDRIRINGISVPATEDKLPVSMELYQKRSDKELKRAAEVLAAFVKREKEVLGELGERYETWRKEIKEKEAKLLALNEVILKNDQAGTFTLNAAATQEEEEQHSKISRDACLQVAFDNSNLSGPDFLQAKVIPSSVQATSALLEEQACLWAKEVGQSCHQTSKSRSPGNLFLFQVSRAAVAAMSVRDEGEDGGDMGTILNGFQSEEGIKVCLQNFGQTPFDWEGEHFIQSLREIYSRVVPSNRDHGPECAGREDQLDLNCSYEHHWPIMNSQKGDFIKIDQLLWEQNPFIPLRSRPGRNGATKIVYPEIKELLDLIKSSPSEAIFLKRALLAYCKDSHWKSFKRGHGGPKVKNWRFWSKNFDPKTGIGDRNKTDKRPFLEALQEAHLSGHSLGLHICSNGLAAVQGTVIRQLREKTPREICGEQSVVLNGVSWQNGRCEGHIKNMQHPSKTLTSGHYPLEELLPFVYGATYYLLNK